MTCIHVMYKSLHGATSSLNLNQQLRYSCLHELPTHSSLIQKELCRTCLMYLYISYTCNLKFESTIVQLRYSCLHEMPTHSSFANTREYLQPTVTGVERAEWQSHTLSLGSSSSITNTPMPKYSDIRSLAWTQWELQCECVWMYANRYAYIIISLYGDIERCTHTWLYHAGRQLTN